MQFIKALVCQTLASAATLLLSIWLSRWHFHFWLFVLLQASISAALSILLRQPVWWQLIHLSFMPAVIIMLELNLPSWPYLLIFLLLTQVFWGTVRGEVPLFLSSSAVGDAVETIVARENAGNFADIGAGIGTIVVRLGARMPALRIDAIEHAPIPWLFAFWRCRKLPNVHVRLLSLWRKDLSEYAVVFAFLSPSVMAKTGDKVRHDMRAGSLFISSSFPVPDWLPETVVELDDRLKTRLYCYRIRSEK